MEGKQDFSNVNGSCVSSLGVGLYCVWDTQLKQFDAPFSCSISHLDDYMSMMINDLQSRFYDKESLFTLVKLGDFDSESGFISLQQPETICFLSQYVKQNERNLQLIIKTLNFLPQGYFKMPEEKKRDIQQCIDDAIQKYVENYVIPDMDVSKYKTEKLRARLQEAEKQINELKSDRDSLEDYLNTRRLFDDYSSYLDDISNSV